MGVVEILTKTFAIILIALGTILTLHGKATFDTDLRQACYLFFAAAVLFVVGSLLFVMSAGRRDANPRR